MAALYTQLDELKAAYIWFRNQPLLSAHVRSFL